MLHLTIRNVSKDVVGPLKLCAAASGSSEKAEHLELLREALLGTDEDFAARNEALQQRLRSTVDSTATIRADCDDAP